MVFSRRLAWRRPVRAAPPTVMPAAVIAPIVTLANATLATATLATATFPVPASFPHTNGLTPAARNCAVSTAKAFSWPRRILSRARSSRSRPG